MVIVQLVGSAVWVPSVQYLNHTSTRVVVTGNHVSRKLHNTHIYNWSYIFDTLEAQARAANHQACQYDSTTLFTLGVLIHFQSKFSLICLECERPSIWIDSIHIHGRIQGGSWGSQDHPPPPPPPPSTAIYGISFRLGGLRSRKHESGNSFCGGGGGGGEGGGVRGSQNLGVSSASLI